jgi:hypothetical protein
MTIAVFKKGMSTAPTVLLGRALETTGVPIAYSKVRVEFHDIEDRHPTVGDIAEPFWVKPSEEDSWMDADEFFLSDAKRTRYP